MIQASNTHNASLVSQSHNKHAHNTLTSFLNPSSSHQPRRTSHHHRSISPTPTTSSLTSHPTALHNTLILPSTSFRTLPFLSRRRLPTRKIPHSPREALQRQALPLPLPTRFACSIKSTETGVDGSRIGFGSQTMSGDGSTIRSCSCGGGMGVGVVDCSVGSVKH